MKILIIQLNRKVNIKFQNINVKNNTENNIILQKL